MPKVSQLPDATFPLKGNELMIFNQDTFTTRGSSTATVKAPILTVLNQAIQFHGARTLNTFQALPADLISDATFSGVSFDTDGFWSPSEPPLFTLPFTGPYLVGGEIEFSTGSDTGTSGVGFDLVPAGEVYACSAASYFDTSKAIVTVASSGIFFGTVGQTVSMPMVSDTLNVLANPRMWIMFLGIAPPPSPPPPPPLANALVTESDDTISYNGTDAIIWS